MLPPKHRTDRKRLWTAEELLRLPDDGMQYELVRGELKVMAPAGFPHGGVCARFLLELGQHVHANQLGTLFTPDTGFQLASDPDTVLCPDISFISAERMRANQAHAGFWKGAPDLAIEIMSASNSVPEMKNRAGMYFAAGTKLVWIVNPKWRILMIYEPDGLESEPRILGEADVLNGGTVLPGFSCRVADIFT